MLRHPLTLLLFLLPAATQATSGDNAPEELLVKGRRSDYSIITENAQKIVEVPGAFGDPLMAAFSLPGLVSAGDGGGSPAVRGSSPSDNRFVVDGAPAGYVFHEFSTSIFNENIIQDFELFSAGFGPAYSNAIGGVFDIKLRDPRAQPVSTTVDLSILRAGIFFEGSVTEDLAFYLSGRGSLLQYFFDEDSAEEEDGIRVQSAPEDSDYQFKAQYRPSSGHKFTLSAMGARDLAEAEFLESSQTVMEDPDFAGEAKIDNRFSSASLRWQFTTDLGSNLDVQLGHYRKNDDTQWGGDRYFLDMSTSDAFAIARYNFQLSSEHQIAMGAEAHRSRYEYRAHFIEFLCTEFDADCVLRRGDLVDTRDSVPVREHMAYLNDHWQMTRDLAVDIGVQAHHNDLTQETFFHPRLALSLALNDDWTLTSSAGSYNRLPDIDKVFPPMGNPDLKSPQSDHFTVGIKHELGNEWSWSVTGYYKTMDQLPLAAEPSDSDTASYTNNVEGEAYGVDLFINKGLVDRWYGWLAISASRSTRTNTLTGVERNYYLDTPLVVNWVMNYQLNQKWTAGSRLTLQSGRAVTPIVGAQPNPYFEGRLLPVYGEPYSKNLPVYARLDLRFKREMVLFGHPGSFNVDILNALNRRNVTDRTLDYKRTTSADEFYLEDEVGLGIIPAVGMTLRF